MRSLKKEKVNESGNERTRSDAVLYHLLSGVMEEKEWKRMRRKRE